MATKQAAAPKEIVATKQRVIKTSPQFPLKGCGLPGARKVRKKTRGSGTAGIMKGGGCKCNWRQKGVCRVSRSYRWPEYALICGTLGKAKSS